MPSREKLHFNYLSVQLLLTCQSHINNLGGVLYDDKIGNMQVLQFLKDHAMNQKLMISTLGKDTNYGSKLSVFGLNSILF